MTQACPSCAAPLKDGAQLCQACGLSLPAPPASRRRDERFTVPTDVRFRKLGSDGAPQKEERTVADDLSRSGMRLLTSWSDLAEGDLVTVEEVGGNFKTGAIVRHVNRGEDQITRVGIEFLEKAPDRLVGTTTSIPRPTFSSVQSSVVPPRPPTPVGISSSLPRPAFSKPPAVPPPSRVEIPPAPKAQAPAPRPIETVLEEIELAKASARELVGEGKTWEALDCLGKAQPLTEGTPEAHGLKILTLEIQAKVPSLRRAAHQSLEDLARDDPRDLAVHSALGRIYRETGLSARARSAFRQVLALDPSNREATAALRMLGDGAKPR